MAHTMDALEEWEIIQADIDRDYFSLDPTNHTSLGEEQLNHYREPEQLKQNHLLLLNSEHDSSETEGDVFVSDQEKNSVSEKAMGRGKLWPVVWWKSQLDNLFKYFGVVGISCKPFWCMSVVAAMVGFVVLRKRVFRMKDKGRAVTTSVKKEAQLVAIAVQLHQTLSEVRRIPVIKILPPGGDANPWAIVPVK
ncbi:hypothetical protein FCM35_KLT18404 [Carex littledalei]|uniref:Transmembrane protein n=1 Tax=Carex littledalei TaxID=544730 RepID=A0A833RAI5_9POAL|nr:hypothetical protein FCM35_KLT18404 [Carex littledalei]